MPDILATVEAVALYLGRPWKFNRLDEPSDYRWEIIDGQGRALYFSKHYKHDRLEISGGFPRGKTTTDRGDHHKIGVSALRPPKDIASDISRRLLPHYLKAYQGALERFQAYQVKDQNLDHIAAALIKVSKGRLSKHSSRSGRTIYFDKGEAGVWYTGEVSMKLHNLSPEKAIQIVAMLN